MRADEELDALWDEFHALVNMTSRELREWLLAAQAGDRDFALPPRGEEAPTRDEVTDPDLVDADVRTGERVAQILTRRKADLTADDVAVMRQVVDIIRAERGEELEPSAGDEVWRHRLMNIGHDPLKPEEAGFPRRQG